MQELIKKSGVKVSFTWIPREKNKEADRLSNVAMDEPSP
ncbi:MAG: reverse transcriptase-like protein [Candidatus Peribacteria bacterium]|nr:reverse transcriptase-like protein [Candidatus Peribacteria bacterium]